jgi:hypothetical protein
VYLLVTKDTDNAAYRVERLKRLKNLSIYAQAERNGALGIESSRCASSKSKIRVSMLKFVM